MDHDSSTTSARLILEDGTLFSGRAFGAKGVCRPGEVVFNTAMCGYQEALTDPSYSGQILVMTASQVGNYGVSLEDVESASISVRGFVVCELSPLHSNHRAHEDLSSWLATNGIPGIQGIDTRALVRKLRVDGSMRGVISTDESISNKALLDQARAAPSMSGANLAATVTPSARGEWCEGLGDWATGAERANKDGEPPFRVIALDCGAKRNIYRHLVERGCAVSFMPVGTSPQALEDAVDAADVDGLFISNGPGDPAAVEGAIESLRQVAGRVPTFGICLGHQLLALSLGATTWKLKFGHRGANQPVRNLQSGRVEITSQNHGFCVDEESLLAAGCEVTHRHLNDGTVAGFRHHERPIFSVQYHPEASPGPHDSAYLFDEFIEAMAARRLAHTRGQCASESG